MAGIIVKATVVVKGIDSNSLGSRGLTGRVVLLLSGSCIRWLELVDIGCVLPVIS